MRSIEDWLAEYNVSHQNRVNKAMHWICVPLIVLSLLGFLYPVPVSFGPLDLPVSLNWAMVIVVFALIYYALLSAPLAAGMLVVCALMLFLLEMLSGLSVALWQLCLLIFVLSWTGQFIGHRVEGRKPSFFKDVQFLLIGPLWLLAFIYRRLNIPY